MLLTQYAESLVKNPLRCRKAFDEYVLKKSFNLTVTWVGPPQNAILLEHAWRRNVLQSSLSRDDSSCVEERYKRELR